VGGIDTDYQGREETAKTDERERGNVSGEERQRNEGTTS